MNPVKLWKSDDDLVALAQHQLFTWVVGDMMDKSNFSSGSTNSRFSAYGRTCCRLECDGKIHHRGLKRLQFRDAARMAAPRL
jgi:hypothetical protein